MEAVRHLKEKLLAEDLEELDNELEPEEGHEGRFAHGVVDLRGLSLPKVGVSTDVLMILFFILLLST